MLLEDLVAGRCRGYKMAIDIQAVSVLALYDFGTLSESGLTTELVSPALWASSAENRNAER